MVKWRKRTIGPKEKENETSLTILIKSSELTIKELEKITSMLLETLSTSLDGKTLEIESKDLRVTSSVLDGNLQSYSVHISF